MKDFEGNTLHVGDEVIFTMASARLYKGKVLKLGKKNVTVGLPGTDFKGDPNKTCIDPKQVMQVVSAVAEDYYVLGCDASSGGEEELLSIGLTLQDAQEFMGSGFAQREYHGMRIMKAVIPEMDSKRN